MTAKVDQTLIQKVAELSRLHLSEIEVTEYVKSVGEILAYVEQLNSVNILDADGKEIEPMYHGIDGALKLRTDVVKEFPRNADGTPKILNTAPEVMDNGFKVPQVL